MSRADEATIGRFPLYIRYKVRLINYWLRITRLQEQSLVKKAYVMLKEFDACGFKNWVSTIKTILVECNADAFFYKEEIDSSDVNICINTVKESLFSRFQKECMDSLRDFPVLRSFILFKNDYRLEKYLLCVRDFKIRKCIAQFRLSSHNLAIEAGRHVKPKIPVDQRLCKMCNLNVVEDECHHLLVCSRFLDQRVKFLCSIIDIDEKLLEGDITTVFNNIMACKEDVIVFNLGVYLHKCLKIRKNL